MKLVIQSGMMLLLAGALAADARAAERVTLHNGFSIPCNHHEESAGRVRLYSTSAADSYIEVASGEIAEIDTVPDVPPAAIKPPTESPAASTGPVTASATVAADRPLNAVDLRQMLSDAGQAHHLDVDLLASVVKAESNGNARARSRAGAEGLMQLMPGTAAELGVEDRFRPEQNVRGGTAYLDTLLTRYHENLALALAAYNAGPAAVDKYRGVPPYRETRLYVARVIHEFNRRVLERERTARAALTAQNSAH